MKFKIILSIIFILAVLSLGAVSAHDSSSNALDDSNDVSGDELGIAFENPELECETVNNQQKELVENEDYKIFVGDIVGVERMPMDATGNITISVDDIERYNQKVSVGGNALFMDDLNLDYGIHGITLKYGGDNKYAGFIKNESYEKKYIDVKDVYARIGGNGGFGSMWVLLDDGVTGHVRVLLDDEEIFDEKYGAGQKGDIYSDSGLFISFGGYHSAYEVQYFDGNQKDRIIKGSIPWSLSCYYPSKVIYGENVEFRMPQFEGFWGVAKFKNATYPFEYLNYKFTISNLDLGLNTVEVTVHVNNGTFTDNLSVVASPVSVPERLYVDEIYDLTFNGPSDCNGDLVLSGMVNGTFKIINGSATVPISSQKCGYDVLHVTYGNFTWDYEIEIADSMHLIVNTLDIIYPWSWEDSDGDSGPGVDIWLYANHDAKKPSGNTSVYLNDKLISEHQGEFTDRIDPQILWQNYEGSGDYTVKAVYSGDEHYGPRTVYSTFYMSSYSCNVYDNTLVVELPSQSKGTLTVKAANRTYSKKVASKYPYRTYPGYEEYEINLNEVKYPIEVCFSGTPDIYCFNETLSEYVSYKSIDYPLWIDYGETALFVINDNVNATLVLYIYSNQEGNRLPVYEIDLRGNANFTIDKNFIDNVLKSKLAIKDILESGQSWGDYYLCLLPVLYTDNGSEILDVLMISFSPKVTGAKSVDIYCGDSKTISLKVYDIFGKIVGKGQVVEISIANKNFSPKTDKNGAISFKIPALAPGSYSFRISYMDFSTEKIINVKHVVSLKTVTVKKSARKLVLTATLKKGKNPIKNKKVTFKFNGKTYRAKTDKKGVAKVTINKSVLKKLKVGKKVTYQATYGKDTVKKSVKVKK